MAKWYRRQPKEVISPRQDFFNASNKHETCWSWQKTKTLEELEVAAIFMIGSAHTLERAHEYWEEMVKHPLLKHLKDRAYACWAIFSRQELDAAVTFKGCFRLFNAVVPELRYEAFTKALAFADTWEEAQDAYYASSAKEPLLRAPALGKWRQFSDQEVAKATTYEDTLRAKQSIPPLQETARHERAVDLALERCSSGDEVIRWLNEFGRRNPERWTTGAEKLLEFAEVARIAAEQTSA